MRFTELDATTGQAQYTTNKQWVHSVSAKQNEREEDLEYDYIHVVIRHKHVCQQSSRDVRLDLSESHLDPDLDLSNGILHGMH